MIDHVGLDVRDYAASKRFYEQVFAPLEYELLMVNEGIACGFGRAGKPESATRLRDLSGRQASPYNAARALGAPD